MNKYRKVIFRADGNSKIGLGHVTRLLALAEMIKDEFSCFFAIQQSEELTIEQFKEVCDGVIQLQDGQVKTFSDFLKGDEIVVLDGYQFTTADQETIKLKGCKLVCIDDLHEQHFVADVVVNHSLTAKPDQYSVLPTTIVNTGYEYILLRKEFLSVAMEKKRPVSFHNVFVCFGGADNENLSAKLASILVGINEIDNVYVLLGSAFKGDIQKLSEIDVAKVKTCHNLQASEIIEIMQKSDFAIVSATGIAYECAAVGLPILTGYYLASQVEFYQALLNQINVWGLGNLKVISSVDIENSISQLRNNYRWDEKGFVDGRQKERYLQMFRALST
jgi:UDP-2,4-diacetamido-2,4,6-trideoxy-beta-L-altropyranose hydrolase